MASAEGAGSGKAATGAAVHEGRRSGRVRRAAGAAIPTHPDREQQGLASGAEQPPVWSAAQPETYEAKPVPLIREQYAAARDAVIDRPR